MKSPESIYRGRHFSPSISGYAVWTYHRFRLSLRDVEDLLAERGGSVSYETIRAWCKHRDRRLPTESANNVAAIVTDTLPGYVAARRG